MFDWKFIFETFPSLLTGLPTTFFIGAVSCIVGTLFAVLVAMTRVYHIPVLQQIGTAYVSIGRGTPLLIQLYMFYYSLPLILNAVLKLFGSTAKFTFQSFPPMITAIIAFAFNVGAYVSEYFRSAILAVDYGQVEAAKSIGIGRMQTFFRIVLPQALIIALPNLCNTFSIMIKASTLVFTITIVEVFAKAKLAAALNLKYFEVYISSMFVFWIITFLLERIFAVIERKAMVKGIV